MKIEDLIGRRFYTLAQKNDVYKIEKINNFGKVVLSFNGGSPFEYHLPDFCLNAIEKGSWILIEEESKHPSLQQILEKYTNAVAVRCATTNKTFEISMPFIIENSECFYCHSKKKETVDLYNKNTHKYAQILFSVKEEPKNSFKLDQYIHNNDVEKRIEAQDKCDVLDQICNPPSAEEEIFRTEWKFCDGPSKVNKSVLPFATNKEVDFSIGIQSTMQKIQELLLVKGKEYRRNNNPYHNFEVAARKKGITPERALDGFLLKHLVSYDDMLNDIEHGVLPKIEVVEEKFDDIIAYFLIQKGQILNRINNGKS